MIGKFFSLNGKLLPLKKAVISIDNIEFSYGFGVYENLKVRNRFIYFPEMHCERMLYSAKIIGLKTSLSAEQIHNNIKNFVNSVKEDSFNIKMMLIGKKERQTESSDLYIFANAPLYLPKKAYSKGVKVITYHGERQLQQAKTLNMLMSYLAYSKARAENAHDALLVDKEGNIREGTRTNFFFTDGKNIYTTAENKVLNGVTRITLIDALSKNGIQVMEKNISLKEIDNYKGFFLTSTSAKVLPISKIDSKEIAIPEIVRNIARVYDEYLDGYRNKSEFSSAL
ncbi:aminotransferase class IV [Candidatus Woesearchaeota archaeon]|nr:aminotransferase class IV [Candidatus Woesearchaeota archaeon]